MPPTFIHSFLDELEKISAQKKATITKQVLPNIRTKVKLAVDAAAAAKAGQLSSYGKQKSTSSPLKSENAFGGSDRSKSAFGPASPTKTWKVGVGSPRKGYIPGTGRIKA